MMAILLRMVLQSQHMCDFSTCLFCLALFKRLSPCARCPESLPGFRTLTRPFLTPAVYCFGSALITGVPRARKGSGQGEEGRQEEQEEAGGEADGAGGRPHPGRLGEDLLDIVLLYLATPRSFDVSYLYGLPPAKAPAAFRRVGYPVLASKWQRTVPGSFVPCCSRFNFLVTRLVFVP